MVSSEAAPRRRPRRHTGDQPAEKAIFEATERLLAKSALHEISVAQILVEAGLSRASFYHYFSDKYEVVATLVSAIFNDLYAGTHAEFEAPWTDPATALRASLRLGIDSWYRHRHVIQAVLENQHSAPSMAQAWTDVSQRFINLLAEQIEREQRAGRAVTTLRPELIASVLVGGAQRIFYVGSTASDPRLASPEHGLDAIVTLALAAIYGNPRGPVPPRAGRLRR